MLIIQTEIKESKGKGVGVFSLEIIKEGQIIWEENQLFFKNISYSDFFQLPKIKQDFIKKYATEYPEEKMFYLDLDDTRFLNHSNNPNMEWVERDNKWVGIALENISIGDEIFCDYVKLNPENAKLDFINKGK